MGAEDRLTISSIHPYRRTSSADRSGSSVHQTWAGAEEGVDAAAAVVVEEKGPCHKALVWRCVEERQAVYRLCRAFESYDIATARLIERQTSHMALVRSESCE